MSTRRKATLVLLALSGFSLGVLLPTRWFLSLLVLGMLGLSLEASRMARKAGYWRAHTEIAEVMVAVMESRDKSDTERLNELVNGIIFQADMEATQARLTWWKRLGLR